MKHRDPLRVQSRELRRAKWNRGDFRLIIFRRDVQSRRLHVAGCANSLRARSLIARLERTGSAFNIRMDRF